MGRIVVGADGSDCSADALRWAAAESQQRDWSVIAVMAWGGDDEKLDDGMDIGVAETVTAKALDTFVGETVGSDAAGSIDRRVTRGTAADVLIEAAEGADLLVVGSRGLGGFRGLLLGSVGRACLHLATCPVAVVHGPPVGEPGDTERIVVGVDGSTCGQAALTWALDEAQLRDARLDVVHAWHPSVVTGGPVMIPIDPAPFEDTAKAVLDTALERAGGRRLAHHIERLVVAGGAAAVLLDIAEGADLIVVGSHGRTGMKAIVLGSVSSQTVNHASCPVVVVPPNRDEKADR